MCVCVYMCVNVRGGGESATERERKGVCVVQLGLHAAVRLCHSKVQIWPLRVLSNCFEKHA